MIRNMSILISLLFSFILVIGETAFSQEITDVYSNTKYGISFTIPKGMRLYTAENPGSLASQISSDTPLILVNLGFTEENINVQALENLSESDLIGLKKILDENPKQYTSLPQYKRISVNSIKIGKQKNKNAVEHIYIMKGNVLGKLRQITFVHKSRGFIFTCATAVDRFDNANQQLFDPIFTSMNFK